VLQSWSGTQVRIASSTASLHSSHSTICNQSCNTTFTRQICAVKICRLVTRFLPSSPGFKLDRKQGLPLSFLLVLKFLCPASSPILISFAEILVSVTGIEYAFTKAPKNMRSLVMSIFLSTSAFGVVLDAVLACKLPHEAYFMILCSV